MSDASELPGESPADQVRGLIGWFAKNHVAANLLMFGIIGLGAYALWGQIKKESFPEFVRNQIQVQVPFLGATPEEVEQGVILRVEEAVKSIEGVREIRSVAGEGAGTVSINLDARTDLAEKMDEVKLAVDGISTFPAETERPIITESRFRQPVINIQLAGDLDETTMKELADRLREEIVALPAVSFAQVFGSRPFEISIEISEDTLRQYGLTLDQVAQVIRQWSIDLPGGSIRSQAGDIRLRATGQAYTGQEYEQIVLLTRPDGTRIRLGDIAEIRDQFAEVQSFSFFNGKRSFGINVMASEEENPIDVSAAVNAFVEERNQTLPPEAQMTAWADNSFYLKGRIDMMLKNMALGGILVFLVLGVFLHLKVAAWVIIGLPVAFLGAFMMMPVPFIDVSINVMSLFAFILVLGVVVDDAIIIAESAYTETEKHGYTLANIVRGAQRVAVPATFGVLTTIMAFTPMLLQSGATSSVAGAIAWIVILCLVFSLVESKLILPSHLAIMRSSHGPRRGVSDWVDGHLKRFIESVYKPLLTRAIEFRWTTLATFIAIAILMIGLVLGDFIRISFFPEFGGDFVMAQVEIQEGAPDELIVNIVQEMTNALHEVDDELKAEYGFEEDVVKHVFAYVQNGRSGRFQVELSKVETRAVEIDLKELETRWRAKVGEIAGTTELRISTGNQMGGGPPVAFRLSGRSIAQVEAAADDLAAHLKTYDGLYEVESSASDGPEELRLTVRPEAEAMGVTLSDLARQVRQAFYGVEAQRIQRGDSDVRVRVRYPRSERRSIGNLENMWIRLPDGRQMPFHAVATYKLERGYNSISRIDGKRTVTVSANADLGVVEPGRVAGTVTATFLPTLRSRYPDVEFGMGTSLQEQQDSVWEMIWGFMGALLGIYVLMAIPLKSYLQPLVIMTVIPFGLIGAVIGHWIIDIPVNAISLLGFFALAGVVVNDSLILVHFVNRRVAEGVAPMQAAVESGAVRFRPILLTSLTTFFGLVPIVLERSMQAQIVIPMAVSLAFGIVFATAITLILIPCLYSIQANLHEFFLGKRELHAPEPAMRTTPTPSSATAQGSALR
ncbi:MAG: efflux RND transporter permease subunit [Gammaproteobacteria bacterium]|nr:efflux RND transporter permease subunit [Gammaproteobacteria bacterium]